MISGHAESKQSPVSYSKATTSGVIYPPHTNRGFTVRHAQKLILLLLLVSLAGCSSIQDRKKGIAMDHTLSSYRTAMRWGHWESLLSFRDPKAPAVPELDLDNIRVTEYEIRQPPVEIEENKVVQVIQIQYVLRDQQRLRKLREKQEWRFDPEAKRWTLFSPFPEFR